MSSFQKFIRQLILELHEFELHESTYTWFFFHEILCDLWLTAFIDAERQIRQTQMACSNMQGFDYLESQCS